MTELNRMRQDSFTSNIEFNIKQLDKTVTIKIALEGGMMSLKVNAVFEIRVTRDEETYSSKEPKLSLLRFFLIFFVSNYEHNSQT